MHLSTSSPYLESCCSLFSRPNFELSKIGDNPWYNTFLATLKASVSIDAIMLGRQNKNKVWLLSKTRTKQSSQQSSYFTNNTANVCTIEIHFNKRWLAVWSGRTLLPYSGCLPDSGPEVCSSRSPPKRLCSTGFCHVYVFLCQGGRYIFTSDMQWTVADVDFENIFTGVLEEFKT